ncbi:hypothetical protein RSOLAG22IIIB_01083 [Rhizoctonia solani]|uniref:ATP-dependent DNA helicase RecQ zinc-binding domain-containing protein n=1 Tax=Rhizoctonia solani TaxID=456999 RepID=A0A0K6G1N8_9AGAM|nr:hypothetical protein RSOLAG22IIIB_01083 [Rhizoctonia solani]
MGSLRSSSFGPHSLRSTNLVECAENFARGDTINENALQLWLTAGVFGVPLASDGALEANHFEQSRVYDIRVNDYTMRDEQLWKKVDKNSKEVKAVLQYAQSKSSGYQIDLSLAATHSGVPRVDLTRVIQTWELSGIVECKASQVRHRYRVLKELPSGKPELLSAIANQLHEGQLAAEYEAIEKIQGVLKFATGDECLAHSLAVYFGDEKAVPHASCGTCTQCLTGEGVTFNPNYTATVDPVALRNVLSTCLDRDDPRMVARFAIGITSPRLTAAKLTSHALFGSMAGVDWEQLYMLINAECAAAGYTPAPDGSYSHLSQRRASGTYGGNSSKTTTPKATSTRGRSSSGSYQKKSFTPYGSGSSRGRGRGGYRGGRK